MRIPRIILWCAVVLFAGCVAAPPKGSGQTLDDEIATHGRRYIIEYDGYNKERRRQERMLTWYRKGVGTHIVLAYKASGQWIVFQVKDEKEGSKW